MYPTEHQVKSNKKHMHVMQAAQKWKRSGIVQLRDLVLITSTLLWK